MDIRSLFEQTMSRAKNLFASHSRKKIVTKLAHYNFLNKHTQTKSLVYVKKMKTKIVAMFSKASSFVKNACLQVIIFAKSIWLKIVKALSQVGSFFKHNYLKLSAIVGASLSGFKANSVRLGRFVFAQHGPLKAHSSRVLNHFSLRRMQYGLFIGLFGVTTILCFFVHTYFKKRNLDELENIPAIKSLAFRLTQTESKLRDAQAQIQAMSSLEHEVKQTASKLGETEESLKERLAKAEHKVEEIDTIGESLKLAGLKSLISKNKKKASHKIKSLSGQSNDLDSVKEKIRKEVKRQMKVLEAGDNNSF